MTRLTSLLICLALANIARAEDPSDLADLPLFASDDTLHIEVQGPLRTLTRERSKDDYLDGVLRVTADDGSRQEIGLKFRARGNYRHRKRTCQIPPVRLNLDRDETDDTVFAGQNILKLVTHCRLESDRYEDYVVKEYLAYRILRLHTPVSFRARLVRVTWIDTEGKHDTDERYGFLIEHKDELAARVGLEASDVLYTSSEKLDSDHANVIDVFEYLIGNTDYSLIRGAGGEACCHNAILLTADEETYYPVPYDFDFSGLVNAPYAGPNPKLDIETVTTRLYRGDCSQVGELEDTLAMFMSKKDAVLALVDEQEGLSPRARHSARRFIEKFYEAVDEPDEVERRLIRKCS